MPTLLRKSLSQSRLATRLTAPLLLVAPILSAQELPPVVVDQAERTEIVAELRLTGTITSPRTARLAPEVNGRVAEIAVDAGDEVDAGQILLRLDDEIAHLELAEADAALREATAELDDARRRLAEARDLAKSSGIADTEVRTREAEVNALAAVVDRRKAELGHGEALVARHRLEAPFPGVIARRLTDLGEWVGPNTPVLELVAVDRLRLDLQVPQDYFGRVTLKTLVEVRLAARPDEPLQVSVTRIVPVSDPQARTFLARIALDNGGRRMTPGMSAHAILRMRTGTEGVAVSRDALIRYPDGRIAVWITEGEGPERTVRERRVRTGLAFGDRIEIRSGLEEGMPVVVRGNESLREGQSVRVENDE
jgi:membrane fusion protein (multidrug efflux system)